VSGSSNARASPSGHATPDAATAPVTPTQAATRAATHAATVADYLRRWGAVPVGVPFSTATSILAPALRGSQPVMLKIATEREEARGNRLMLWWDGRGAARVLEHHGDTVLLERATGARSVAAMATSGGDLDDSATRILCRVCARLHAIDDPPPRDLIRLEPWFRDLFTHAEAVGGFHARAALIAGELLADQQEIRVLHGDLHHGNVLDFGEERHPELDGWLAIDPKYLIGDRAFDFTNILCNPTTDVAARPGRFARQLDVIADEAQLDRARLLRWCVAWCALSSAWATDGDDWHDATLALGLEAERMLDT